MKITLFNDTGREMHIHPATAVHGTYCEDWSDLSPVETREFEIPDGTEPWIKIWDDLKYQTDNTDIKRAKLTILVSHIRNNK